MTFYVASSSQRISAGTTVEGTPGLTKCADGSLFAAWRKASLHSVDNANGAIHAARSTDGGATWTALGEVIKIAGHDSRDVGLTTLADGRVMVQFFRGNGLEVMVAFSSDHGSTWTTPAGVPFTAATTIGCSTAPVQFPSGDIVVAMYGGNTSQWSVRVMRSTDGGATWGSEVTAADGVADSRQYAEPWIGLLPSGDLMILMRCDTEAKVYRTTSSDGGATWTAPAAVTAAMTGLGRPSWIATTDGQLLGFNTDANENLWAKSLDNGVTWSAWAALAPAGTTSVYAQPAYIGSGVYGVAHALEGSNPGVHFVTITANTGSDSIQFADTFDAQAAWPIQNWTVLGTGSMSTATATGSGKCITGSGAQVIAQKYGLGNLPSRSFGFRYKVAALPGADQYIAGFTNDAGISATATSYLRLTSTGAIKATFRTITTVYGTTAAGVITANTWHRIDVSWTYGASGTGAVKIRVDGVEVLNVTGITVTVAGGNAGMGGMTLATHAGTVSFDDVTVTTDVNYAEFTAPASTVAAPALALTMALPAPTVTVAASAVTVAAPALALTVALLAPTVASATPTTITPPPLAVALAAPAPTVVESSKVTVAAPVLEVAVAVPAPVVLAASTGLPGVLYISSPSPRFSTVLLTEGGVTWDADLLRVASRSERGSAVSLILTPAPVPLVIREWPVMRQAHVMPALTAAAPRMRPHVDYDVDTAEVGRDHVFIGGVDVTFLRNAPTIIGETVESAPLGDDRASIEFPQIKPWDVPGAGDLSMLREDAPVEVALIRPDGSRVHRFDGFVSSFSDYSGDGREAYTVQCEGVLAQAMHEPWEPPLFLDETDIGILIPRALNAVPGRRWRKIPETVTGFTSRDRGSQDSSVWQQVQNWLAPAWTLDGRQLMLKRYAHGVYRLELKAATSTVHWTVTKGAHGVGVDLIHDSSTRRDSVYGRGVAPDGGTWANWFFPFLDAFVPPAYPMAGFANMAVGTTDGDTTTGRGVTDWQRRMRDLGYPITVDGVMNSADTKWVRKVQADRGLTPDGSLGPQTWNGTFDPGPTEVDLRAVRRPLATKPEVEEYLYAANGARTGKNPAWDSRIIRHAMPGVNFGPGIRKSEAFAPAASILEREGTTGAAGRIVLKTDPHEADSSRLFIRAGDNVNVIGHRGETVVQVADVSHGTIESTLTVDERARDALAVEAILERNREARKSPSNRPGKSRSTDLDRADIVQYESESKAGVLPRYAVNGNSGLWSVLPMFVSQFGVAKIELHATTPKAEIVCGLFSRPVRPNLLEALLPDPLASSDGWYDNIQRLKDKHGLMEVFGTPDNPGGYWPRQKGEGPLTGDMEDTSGTLYDSGYGGVVWVALFTSRSTWVHGRIFPAVQQ